MTGRSDGGTPAADPLPAPDGAPHSHQVTFQASWASTIAGVVLGAVLIVLGLAGPTVAVALPAADNRIGVFVAGPIIVIVGVLLWCNARRRRTPRTFVFTESGLAGHDVARHWFRVPWTALESITIQGWRPRSVRRWFTLNLTRTSSTAALRLTFRPGVTLAEAPQLWVRAGTMPLTFWHRADLIDSMAYGCETFAAEKFQGVTLL